MLFGLCNPALGQNASPGTATQEYHRLELSIAAAQGFFPSDLVPEIQPEGISESLADAPGLAFSTGVWLTGHWYLGAEWVVVPTTAEVFSENPVASNVELDRDVAIYAGSLRYALRNVSSRIVPYAAAGAGAKRYSGVSEATLAPFSTSDFTGSLGAGVLIDPGWVARIRLEARDFVSRFTPEDGSSTKIQHDIFVTAGLAVGIF